ncbi:MAG TPA: hypothetical protein VNQ76_20835 [Planctomicrobium sp.]|nr:hypothetical protein [Planctomicrobium sp.]
MSSNDSRIPDVREEIFPKPFAEQNPESGTKRIVWFVPPIKGHFEHVTIPAYKALTPDDIKTLMEADLHERTVAAKRLGLHIIHHSDEEGAKLVERGRAHRKLWAELADHWFGVTEIVADDVNAILKELQISEMKAFEIRNRAVQPIKDHVGKVSDEDLEKARQELEEFEKTYTKAEIDDSRRLSHRWAELHKRPREILKARGLIRNAQEEYPLLFQTPEDRARLHPLKRKATKENIVNANNSRTDKTEAAPNASSTEDSGESPTR